METVGTTVEHTLPVAAGRGPATRERLRCLLARDSAFDCVRPRVSAALRARVADR